MGDKTDILLCCSGFVQPILALGSVSHTCFLHDGLFDSDHIGFVTQASFPTVQQAHLVDKSETLCDLLAVITWTAHTGH